MVAFQRVFSKVKINKNVFNTLEEEVRAKNKSVTCLSTDTYDKFIHLIHNKFSSNEVEMIMAVLDFAKSLNSVSKSHPLMMTYLNHPIRVAMMTVMLLEEADYEVTMIGLIHNVYEVSGLTEKNLLDEGFSEFVVKGIRLLTIDRDLQYDLEYLEQYYTDIENFSPVLSLIRCLDKLDNVLIFELIREENNRKIYLDLVEKFIVPMSYRLSDYLGGFLQQATKYMQIKGCVEEAALEYECFNNKLLEKNQ
jgi:(p)ppGpp synthase/HD superfamily hydrolase